MKFQLVKCNMMQLTRQRIKKIHASYTLEGTDLENVESIKYLGVTMVSSSGLLPLSRWRCMTGSCDFVTKAVKGGSKLVKSDI